MPMDVSSGQFDGEVFAAQTGKLGSFAKSENLLPVKGCRQLATKSRRRFTFGKAKTIGHRIGDFDYD